MEEKQDDVSIVVPCEVYSRIVGYFRPVRNWNKGKRQEFVDRKSYRFSIEKAEPVLVDADQRTE